MAFTRKVFLIIADRLLLTLTVITAFIHFEGWKSRFFKCISIFLIWSCFLLLNFLRYLWGIVITTVVTLLLQTKARSGIKQIHLPSAGSSFSYCLFACCLHDKGHFEDSGRLIVHLLLIQDQHTPFHAWKKKITTSSLRWSTFFHVNAA